jgi:hypothetical protein
MDKTGKRRYIYLYLTGTKREREDIYFYLPWTKRAREDINTCTYHGQNGKEEIYILLL